MRRWRTGPSIPFCLSAGRTSRGETGRRTTRGMFRSRTPGRRRGSWRDRNRRTGRASFRRDRGCARRHRRSAISGRPNPSRRCRCGAAPSWRRIVAKSSVREIAWDSGRGSGENNDDAPRPSASRVCLREGPPRRRRAATADADDRSRARAARPERHRHGHDADRRGRRQPLGRGGRNGRGAGSRDHGAAGEALEEKALSFYDAFIERDIDAIPAAVRAFRDEHGSIETYKSIGRFAVLAYAPSQHGKHAVLACLAAWALRDQPYFDDVVTQCAIYAAESRQPWSEPPILTPPALDDEQRGDVDELREAIAASERLRGERWLAKRLSDDDLARDYFAAAADGFEDLGHKLIVADAAWRLVPILGEPGRFAALRLGIWEMCAYQGERYVEQGEIAKDLDQRLIDNFIANEGDIESAHALFLPEAPARQADRESRAGLPDAHDPTICAPPPAPCALTSGLQTLPRLRRVPEDPRPHHRPRRPRRRAPQPRPLPLR